MKLRGLHRRAGLGVCLCLAAARLAADPAAPLGEAALRQAGETFLTDPHVAMGQISGPYKNTLEGYDDAVVGFGTALLRNCTAFALKPGGCLVVHRTLGRVVGYDGPSSGAVKDELPRSEAELLAAATAFAQAYGPELFAPGGEVQAERLKVRGDAVRFAFQRVRQGFRMPTHAEVDVDPCTAQVSRWRLQPQDSDAPLDHVIGADEAKAAVEAKLAVDGFEAVAQWLQARGEIGLVNERGKAVARPVYHCLAEVQSLTLLDRSRPGRLGDWFVDAETGAIQHGGIRRFTPQTYTWYRSVGGLHQARWLVPFPTTEFRDTQPMPSPDGRLVAFRTNRLRAGPDPRTDWVAVVSVADGTARFAGDMRELYTTLEWSPDSHWLLGTNRAGLLLYDARTGQARPLGAGSVGAWLGDGRIAVLADGGLVATDPLGGRAAQPLPPLPAEAGQAKSLLGDPRGGLLAVCAVDKALALWRLADPGKPGWTPLVEHLDSLRLQRWSGHQLLVYNGLLDLDTGQRGPLPRTILRWPAEQSFPWVDSAFGAAPCGDLLVTSFYDTTVPLPGSSAEVLWLIRPDGVPVKRLTGFDSTVSE